MAGKVEHAQPAGDEEDRGLRHHVETGALDHGSKRTPRVGLFKAIGVEPQPLQDRGKERPQERVVTIRHAHDGPAPRLEHAGHLPDGLLGLIKVFDGAHGIDGVETPFAKGQLADVGDRSAQAAIIKGPARHGHGRRGDVDSIGDGAEAARPGQYACVPGLVPEVGLEDAQALEVGEVLAEEPTFVLYVVAGGGRLAEVWEAPANPGPEAAVDRA